MDKMWRFLYVATFFVYCNGISSSFEPTNYDLSRRKAGSSVSFESPNYELSRKKVGFGLKEIAQLFLGGGYGGQYPHGPGYYPENQYTEHHPSGHYPAGGGLYPGGGGLYPGGGGLYPAGGGHYPGGGLYPSGGGGHYPPGPPGAHPGCPLCDSSVYGYCSYKQEHDSCCCDGNGLLNVFACRRVDCRKLFANSCDEYNLISECCCVDVQKTANAVGPIPVPVLAPVGNVVAVAIKK